MSKKTELFTSNHTGQIQWMNGQISKQNNSIFLNPKISIQAWEELKDEKMGFIDPQDIESFMSRYLSKSGEKKLYTTLRVAETRAKKNGFRLQCNIDYSANQKLELLMEQTGLSKGELLSRLIEDAI